MKRKLIALCVSSVLVGSGIIFNMNQDVSVPTVEKFTEDTSASVSKHENVDKDEKSIAASANRKAETKESKNEKSSTEKNESQKSLSKQTSTSKSETTASVSSESKKQNSKKEGSSKSSSGSDQKTSTSNGSNVSSKSNNDVVSQPVEKPTETKQEPTPTLEPAKPSYACPGGANPDVSCDVILDTNFYYATYGSQAEADAAGMYYLDEVMYIGDIEITNYSVQPVYRNDHSIAYYGLNLWSNGTLIQ